MSTEAIGAIFTGLASVIVALGSMLASRGRRSSDDIRLLRNDYKLIQKKFRAAMNHIFKLESVMEGKGYSVPGRPVELDPDWDGEEKAKS